MAKQFWKEGDPLADRIVIGRGVMREFADEPERQIIGIAAADGVDRPHARRRDGLPAGRASRVDPLMALRSA